MLPASGLSHRSGRDGPQRDSRGGRSESAVIGNEVRQRMSDRQRARQMQRIQTSQQWIAEIGGLIDNPTRQGDEVKIANQGTSGW